jgi:VanZ family protein
MPSHRRLARWLPPLALMVLIFVFSAQPSLDSGLGTVDLIGRKAIHFLEYALLCFLWWRALEPGLGARRAALTAFLICSAYAATDELHQSFVDDRHGTPVDWLIDSAGAGAAAWRLRLGLRRPATA